MICGHILVYSVQPIDAHDTHHSQIGHCLIQKKAVTNRQETVPLLIILCQDIDQYLNRRVRLSISLSAAEDEDVNSLFGTPQSVSAQTGPQGGSTEAATDTPFASGKLCQPQYTQRVHGTSQHCCECSELPNIPLGHKTVPRLLLVSVGAN